MDRPIGIYEEQGVTVNREASGPLFGTLAPPCVSHSVAVLERLLALNQGVRSVTVRCSPLGDLIEDAVAIQALGLLVHRWFRRMGHADYRLITVFHQRMGGLPENGPKAFAASSWAPPPPSLAAAEKAIVRRPYEAAGMLTKEANLQGLRASRQIVSTLADQ